MTSGFLGLPSERDSGKMARRAALSAARSRLTKRSLRDGHGALSGHTVRGFFMSTPEQLNQHIQDTDAIWALEGFKRTAFTDRIAAALKAGEMTPAAAIEALQAELKKHSSVNSDSATGDQP